MKKFCSLIFLSLVITSCTPATEKYCMNQGLVQGTDNFGECMRWAEDAESQFRLDYERCLVQAKITYPDSLYDHGRSIRTQAFDRRGRPYYVDDYIPGDYQKNAELDNLRRAITNPCMQDKGWHNPTSWKHGRRK